MSTPSSARSVPACLDTNKIAIVYPRQSTRHQTENNVYSLDNQLRLKQQAQDDGFSDDRIVVILDDLGVSGRTIEDRVGMTRALDLIRAGKVGAMYAEDLTRVSRDEFTVDHMVIGEACQRASVPLFLSGCWYDLTTRRDRRLFKQEAVESSENWSGHLEKMHANQRMKAERGRVATQSVKWGYRVNRDVPRKHPERDKLIVHEPEAAVIRVLVAELPRAGSLRELYRRNHPITWPDGRPLTYRTLGDILRKPVYRGHYAWSDVLVENSHEAIIGPADAAMIDALLAKNKVAKRGVAHQNGGVLCGMIWCPECDGRVHHSQSNRKPDYRCQVKDPAKRAKFHFSANAPIVDRVVLTDLWDRLGDDLVGTMVRKMEADQAAHRQVIDLGATTAQALKRRQAGLLKSIADPDLPQTLRKPLYAELADIVAKLEALETRGQAVPHFDADLIFYRRLQQDADLMALLPATWADEPLDWRRSWVRWFINRVEITKKSRGSFVVAIQYQDGVVRHHAVVTKAGVTDEELQAVRSLWNHPERPSGRSWGPWMMAEMEKAGYPRSQAGMLRTVALARGKPRGKASTK